MSRSGDKLDVSGIERAIAGVFSTARHPNNRNPKRGMEGTPGRVYLYGGCNPRLLAARICKGSDRHVGRIQRLATLTGTRDRTQQVLIVESVLRKMVARGDLWYAGDSWFADAEFLGRQKQFSDALRTLEKEKRAAGRAAASQSMSGLVLEGA